MNIWLVSLFEPTPVDNTRPMRFMGIANTALAMGHTVTQISGTFRHSTKKQRFEKTESIEVGNGYKLEFIHTTSYEKNISIDRLRSHARYTRNLLAHIETLEKPDVILVAMPPLSPAEALCRWGKKHGIPVYIDIIDPWPSVFLRLVPNSVKPAMKLALLPMFRKIKYILNHCHGVISIANQYIRWAKEINPRLKNTEAFFPTVPYKEVQEYLSKAQKVRQDKLTLIYAGNLGVAYDIPCILKAAEILDQKYPGKTSFLIAGMGHYVDEIRRYESKLQNVKYLGRLDYASLMEYYSISDLGLAQYSPGATQAVTYKLFDYLSAGLPILNSLLTEMAELIETRKVGLNNNPGDFKALAENVEIYLNSPEVLSAEKSNSRLFAMEKGDNEKVYKELVTFLTRLN